MLSFFHWHEDKVVEFLADFLPEGHVLVEQGNVIFVVVADFQVQEFVQYHVIQAADGRMRQMQIEPEFPCGGTAAPLILHDFCLPAVAL